MNVLGDEPPPGTDDLVRVFDGDDELREHAAHLSREGWVLVASTSHPRRQTLRRRLMRLFKGGRAVPPPRVVATFRRHSADDHHQ